MSEEDIKIKTIADLKKQAFLEGYGETLRSVFTLDWVFSTILEKIIVFGSVLWTLYSIIRAVWMLF